MGQHDDVVTVWQGEKSPVKIVWEKNQRDGGVTATVEPIDATEKTGLRLRVFPGRDEAFFSCPHQDLALKWADHHKGQPQIGDETMCWIAVRTTANNTLVGFAFPAIGRPCLIERRGNITMVDDHGVTTDRGYQVVSATYWYDDDSTEITIK